MELQTFNHPLFGTAEILVKDEKLFFVATQSALTLGYKNPHDAIKRHCKVEGFVFHEVLTTGGKQQVKFISEGNLYRLITKSDLPSAVKFESWVFDEVIPSIRKHGAYMTPQTIEETLNNPDFIIGLATRLKEEQTARKQAELLALDKQKQIEEQQPLVTFAKTCLVSESNVLVRELAKLASKNGIVIGEKRLYQRLREWGYICKTSTEPTQRAIDAGYFEIKVGSRQTPEKTFTFQTTTVSPRGQMHIINRLIKEMSA